MAFDGTRFLVAWSDARGSLIGGRDIYAAHVTRQGPVAEAGGFVVNEERGDQVLPLAASAGGGQSVVTWTTGTAPGVFAARVNASGTVLDTTPIVLSTSVVEAHVLYPKRAVVGEPSGYLAVWCASTAEVARCDLTARRMRHHRTGRSARRRRARHLGQRHACGGLRRNTVRPRLERERFNERDAHRRQRRAP